MNLFLGLFHKVIVMSGSVTGQYELPPHQLDLAKRQATVLGCQSNGSVNSILDCFKKV